MIPFQGGNETTNKGTTVPGSTDQSANEPIGSWWPKPKLTVGVIILIVAVVFGPRINKFLAPYAPQTASPSPQPTAPIPSGDITATGTSRGVYRRLPDTGGVLYMDTDRYGRLEISLPGSTTICAATRVDIPTLPNEKLEVHGFYANGKVTICAEREFYLKRSW